MQRWDPFAEMMQLRRAMDRLWDEQVGGRLFGSTMPVDLYEEGDSYVLRATMPGVQPEDIDLSVTGNTISVRAETRQPPETRPRNYFIREHEPARYARTITLPSEIDPDQIVANYEHGVLTVRLPKPARMRPRQIQVKFGPGGARVEASSGEAGGSPPTS